MVWDDSSLIVLLKDTLHLLLLKIEWSYEDPYK